MAVERRRAWLRLRSVRARTTLAATAVVGIALAIAAVSLLVLLRHSLVGRVDDVAEARADDVSAAARQDNLPAVLPDQGDDSTVVQVVVSGGRVVAASELLAGAPPISTLVPPGREPVNRTLRVRTRSGSHQSRVIALRTSFEGRTATVYVASSLEPVEDALSLLRRALGVGAPSLLVLVGVTAWTIVGRTLAPVDAIRSEVADISARSLDRRVPVPAGDDEVVRLARTMNTMLDRLESSTIRQRRFVADASHELRTPLASIRADLEVAMAYPDRTDWPATAADLLGSSRRMEALVRDLLYLAQVDDGASRPPGVLLDLDTVVFEEIMRTRGEAPAGIDSSRVSGAAVVGHPNDLARVVRNLLDNAVRHAASCVVVELGADNGCVELVVSDDGAGVPLADRARIFERFERLDDARSRETGGAGLGLAIAKEIVAAHLGTITVEGGAPGARFVVRLPAAG